MTLKREEANLRIALVGQPNSGKSTLFNAVAGFKVNTGNFAGTTVAFTETVVSTHGKRIALIDLPGTYSITSLDLAEQVTRDYLLSGNVDVVINIIDASMLSRSLELTLQLIEMNIPLVVAMNMMDEAERKGVEISLSEFSRLTGVSAFPVVAVRGLGVDELFSAAVTLSPETYRPNPPVYDRDVEHCLGRLVSAMPEGTSEALQLDGRFSAIRLLEMDAEFERRVGDVAPNWLATVLAERKQLAELHDWPERGVFASHRHALVLDVYETIATHTHSRGPGLRERLDALIVNPLGGVLVIGLSLFLMFYASFSLGDLIAGWLKGPFDALHGLITRMPAGVLHAVASGLSDGIEAGLGIVLPYLVPLLFLLAIYEDTGLLPRIAFMADGLLHRVGMHGKSIVPIILGFGCNVPAIMATRNLENERDRRLAMLIIPFVTCSARTVVILGLVGKYLGALAATLVYVGTIALTLLISFLLSRLDIHLDAGIVMEVPPLRRPYARIIVKKVWLRLREFFVMAWPIIAIGSMVLALASWVGIDSWVNHGLSPLTMWAMKLPEAVGIPLFLGVFRKELALAMLSSAIGTMDVSTVLSAHQLVTLTVFTVLYIPCIATLATLRAEGGWKLVFQSALLNLTVAVGVAAIVAHV